jgi:4-alpha-glucanotransferase
MARVCGVLMPITSLPSPYGIGTIGKEAREFADFLKASGQSIWQILPVGPTSYGDSPYQSFSTYAGNPYMIDLDTLVEEGILSKDEIEKHYWCGSDEEIDYGAIYYSRFEVLKVAYENDKKRDQRKFTAFKRKNSKWIKDYALYMAVKRSFDNKAWPEWDDESIKLREPKAIDFYTKKFKDEIDFWKWVQFKFYEQWESFRAYVNGLGIKILGDMPIYVAMDSADTWANPEVFWLDEERRPVCVAGCPPDYFSATGQLWGNPLYDWDYLEDTGFEWWMGRIAAADKLFDITRIDHFRAFDTYYAIPFGADNAIDGEWIDGPGIEFFEVMRKKLGDVSIVAEDLGELFDSVKELLKESGYPGMKVLEFAFGDDEENDFLPHNYKDGNCVVYTGTHDNDTVLGWYSQVEGEEKEYCDKYMKEFVGMDIGTEVNWKFIEAAYKSIADTAVVQMQDILGLGSEARMNVPSTLGGNWAWRIRKDALTPEISARLKDLAVTYNRV